MFVFQYPTCLGGLTCEAQKLGCFTIIHRKLWSLTSFVFPSNSLGDLRVFSRWLVIVSTATGAQRMSVTCEWLQYELTPPPVVPANSTRKD